MNNTEDTSRILCDAAATGDVHRVETIINQGVDINSKSPSGNTALLFAALRGRTACVKFLIEHGADLNSANEFGYTPLICAAVKGAKEVVQLLLEAGASTTGRASADDNNGTSSGKTALTLAIYNNHLEIANLLRMYDASE